MYVSSIYSLYSALFTFIPIFLVVTCSSSANIFYTLKIGLFNCRQFSPCCVACHAFCYVGSLFSKVFMEESDRGKEVSIIHPYFTQLQDTQVPHYQVLCWHSSPHRPNRMLENGTSGIWIFSANCAIFIHTNGDAILSTKK